MKLEAQTILVSDLSVTDEAAMLELMQEHYEGVCEDQFVADLHAKQWVILLHREGRFCGFSTQVLFEHCIAGHSVRILFSGDTIIDKSCWGSLALPVAWGRLMLSLAEAEPQTPLFWLLTSKGYKTYRFLPVFFREFYPRYARQTPPFEKLLLESVAARQFGRRFDADAGIVRATLAAQRLREGVANISAERLRDPHVAFFQQANPGHAQGDELVCLARGNRDNLTPYIRRQL